MGLTGAIKVFGLLVLLSAIHAGHTQTLPFPPTLHPHLYQPDIATTSGFPYSSSAGFHPTNFAAPAFRYGSHVAIREAAPTIHYGSHIATHEAAQPMWYVPERQSRVSHREERVKTTTAERLSRPTNDLPAYKKSERRCSTYKAYVRTTSTTDSRAIREKPSDARTLRSDYEVLVLEAVEVADSIYDCKMSSQASAVSTYSFKMKLAAKANFAGKLVYRPILSDFVERSLSGLEITGEEAVMKSSNIVARYIKTITKAEQLTFSEEGHIVVRTSEETIVFIQSCSSKTAIKAGPSRIRPYDRRRLQETPEDDDAAAIIYTADASSYKVNGAAAEFGVEYENPVDMECAPLHDKILSCFLKVTNVIRFSATVEEDSSVMPGPVITTRMLAVGAAAEVERSLIALLESWNELKIAENGNMLFKSNNAELTWVPKGLIQGTDEETEFEVAHEELTGIYPDEVAELTPASADEYDRRRRLQERSKSFMREENKHYSFLSEHAGRETASVGARKECSIYKAHVKAISTTDMFYQRAHTNSRGANRFDANVRRRLQGLSFATESSSNYDGGNVRRGYEVLVLEAVRSTEDFYRCRMYSEHSSMATYSFNMKLTSRRTVAGQASYRPVLSELAQVSVSGLEITGEEVIKAETDVVAQTIKGVMAAEQLTFSEEGHIIIRAERETIVFIQSCSYEKGVKGLSPDIKAITPYMADSLPLIAQGGSDSKRKYAGKHRSREERVAPAVLFKADTNSYKFNGVATKYHSPVVMECSMPEDRVLSCFAKITNTIKFNAAIAKDSSVVMGPIVRTHEKATGPAAIAEEKLLNLLNGLNKVETSDSGDMVFQSSDAELTWEPEAIISDIEAVESGVQGGKPDEGDDEAEWTTYEGNVTDYSQEDVSGQSHSTSRGTMTSDLDAFPLRCKVKQVRTEVFVVMLKVVNEYKLTIRRKRSGWVTSSPLPLTHFVGPASSMLVESDLLKTFAEVEKFRVDHQTLVISTSKTSVTLRAASVSAVDETLKLSSARSNIVMDAIRLEGSSFSEATTVRITEVTRNAYKVLLKSSNTYCFDVKVVEGSPVVSPFLVTEMVSPVKAEERTVLEVFRSATEISAHHGEFKVTGPYGSLVFV